MASMDLWGVSKTGFYRPTIEDIIAEKNKLAKEYFGEDFDTGELTPQGKMFRINAAAESKLLEIAEGIYYSIFPSTATNLSLDRVCEFANITRESAGYAVHEIKVYGKKNYVIEAGTKFKNDKGLEFYSVQESVIDTEETQEETTVYYAIVTIQCTQSGEEGNVSDINATSEVNISIQDIKYHKPIAYGTPIESDPELRNKFKEAINGLGTNTTAAIKANVLRVAHVNDVLIIDNTTKSDSVITEDLIENDVVTRPGLIVDGRSYAVIVHSDNKDNAEDIAKAIRQKQPLGILQSGLEAVKVRDDAGVEHTIKFTYVEPIVVNIAITCKVDNSFSTTGTKDIEDNVSSYINNLGIGEEVVYSRLYDYIYNVVGVYKVKDIVLEVDGVEYTTDVSVPQINIAKVGNITITTEGV